MKGIYLEIRDLKQKGIKTNLSDRIASHIRNEIRDLKQKGIKTLLAPMRLAYSVFYCEIRDLKQKGIKTS